MSSSSKLMLLREFKELKLRPKSSYFQVYGLKDDNIYEWVVFIIGPPKTFYAGGIYKAVMRFPQTYPMEPPSLQFVCTMYHPNVYSDGKVCISTLQVPAPGAVGNEENSMFWRPVVGVEQALLSVISLLSDPNHEDPANSAAAEEWINCPEDFKRKLKAIKEQSKELVPADFSLPIVVDPPETLRSEKEENEDDGNDEDNETAFVYSSSDEDEEEDEDQNENNQEGNEDEKDQGDEQITEETSENTATRAADSSTSSAEENGGEMETSTTAGSSSESSSGSSSIVCKRGQGESDKSTESFIKSGVAEVTRSSSQKRRRVL